MYLIKLPMPPTVNDYYGYNRHSGVRYVKKAGKDYKEAVRKIVLDNGWDFNADVPLKVMVVLNFAEGSVNDLDNRMKGLLDACTYAKVWYDDSIIDDLHIIRGSANGIRQVLLQVQAIEDVTEY